MLLSLTIENFAIIDQVDLDFQNSMTVLSGETGAGKSIIIDALSVLCGARGSIDYIRHGANRLLIEGLFSYEEAKDDIQDLFHQFGLDLEEDTLIIRREINQSGKNIIRVNGQLANVTFLRQLSPYLVDIHGQQDHQHLLNVERHVELLDNFIGEKALRLRQDYEEAFNAYKEVLRQWNQAHTDEQSDQQRLDFLEFQSQEIEKAQLVPGEEEELLNISNQLHYQQTNHQALQTVSELLSDSPQSILVQLSQVTEALNQVKGEETTEDIQQTLQSVQTELQEISHQVALMDQAPLMDDYTIDEVETRLNQIQQLTQKYHRSVDEILVYYDEISQEIYQLVHKDRYLQKLEEQLKVTYDDAFMIADLLHQLRKEYKPKLEQAVQEELKDLYMANSLLSIQLTKESTLSDDMPVSLTATGFDEVEFLISTNVGEPLKPLTKVASGGEMSRFILALKTVFSKSSPSQTMVFDEIDTGVSGRVAGAIAQKMKQISYYHQVLCITHLPQVAAAADHHLYIQKVVEDGQTLTKVKSMNDEEKINAIALMISADELTQTSIDLAKELLTHS
ncbi:DNA repair protein RecN [Dolosicoccus paucivorans]|uniref:DNA repair protein RecN n=1 Tax=Dolosicoccus paucivorans TaxID=84521 RepID=A0A2N6SQ92_9LACT|nr:DNA repair protein RecN [Dolosicoccus paucivorans]PMB84654.1 DNA repair protein RecN [Dolosicoccus paucivorans]PMC59242.1 DNA repair protein RecN [Dolosicoccus paucivorans]